MNDSGTLVKTLLELPVFQTEWVLWLLVALSILSIAVMIERALFFRARPVDTDALARDLKRALADDVIAGDDSLLRRLSRADLELLLN